MLRKVLIRLFEKLYKNESAESVKQYVWIGKLLRFIYNKYYKIVIKAQNSKGYNVFKLK